MFIDADRTQKSLFADWLLPGIAVIRIPESRNDLVVRYDARVRRVISDGSWRPVLHLGQCLMREQHSEDECDGFVEMMCHAE